MTKNKVEKNSPIAFVDFEMNTNGDMNKSELEIIEFGVVIVNNDKIEKYRGFVKPVSADHIYEYTTFVTGIKNEEFIKPLSLNMMISKLSYYTRNCKNIYFWGDADKNCLLNEVEKLEYCNTKHLNDLTRKMKSFQETFLSVKDKKERLEDYAKAVGAVEASYKQKHRALPDAILLSRVYRKIVK